MTSPSFSLKGTTKKFFTGLALCMAGAGITYIEQHVPLLSSGVLWLLDTGVSNLTTLLNVEFLDAIIEQWFQKIDMQKEIAFLINTQIIATARNWVRTIK